MQQAAPKTVSEACDAIDRLRLSRAKTQHAIARSRKPATEILRLLMELRLQHARRPKEETAVWLGPLRHPDIPSLMKKLEGHNHPRGQ
jgi:hypothetical protein